MRFLEDATIRPRLALIRRFGAFTNSYPWQWEPVDTHLRDERDRGGMPDHRLDRAGTS
ncbi:hypothetical protein ACQPZ2_20555 [Nocardia pseudovaccinii]|uniref:hypothetical protein n=1 Tax=Nocardia pseudovaccinii TaxID=189540 RepID=UPI003D8D0380